MRKLQKIDNDGPKLTRGGTRSVGGGMGPLFDAAFPSIAKVVKPKKAKPVDGKVDLPKIPKGPRI